MPDITTDEALQAAPPSTPMDAAASRRVFLAGTGALALAATAGASTALTFAGQPATGSADVEDAADALTDPRSVVAYIRHGETEITIMSGDREVVIDDPALARLLSGKVG